MRYHPQGLVKSERLEHCHSVVIAGIAAPRLVRLEQHSDVANGIGPTRLVVVSCVYAMDRHKINGKNIDLYFYEYLSIYKINLDNNWKNWSAWSNLASSQALSRSGGVKPGILSHVTYVK